MINTIKSTHLWLVLVGFHVRAQSLPSKSAVKSIPTSVPCQAKKDSNIPFPGRTRLVKCPTSGPTKTIQSPPHALPPPSRWLYIDRCILVLLCIWGQFSMYKPLGSLYLEGRFNREFFALLVWGAYIWRGVHVFSDFYGIHMYICAYMKRQKTSQIPLKAIIASFEAFAREKSSCYYLTCMGLYVTKSGMLPERPKKSVQKLLKTFLSHCFSKCTQCVDQE